jgi:hypothetical protein
MLSCGRKLPQNAGRSGFPNNAQPKSGMSCTHGIPAGFPCGMPGIGEVIDGAMQHAPQPERHSIRALSSVPRLMQARRPQ